MAFYDVSCVICNSTISRYLIGSTDPEDLLQRQIRVDKKRLALEAGNGRLSVEWRRAELDDPNRFHLEYQSFNPALVTAEGLKWLKRIRGLGFTYDASGARRAFLSGPLTYVDGGILEVVEADDTNNHAPGRQFQCVNEIFPFHERCYELLARVITGSSDIHGLDKEALFKALGELISDMKVKLDYGPVEMQDLSWWSEPGEESYMTSILDSNDFRTSSIRINLADKTISDPFGQLSYDILHQITSHLPVDSLLALIEASAVINRATRPSGFWRIAFKKRMPWFWELHELLQEHLYSNMNFKHLFLWTMGRTITKFGMTDPLMVVANRRRIWNVCQAIYDEYTLWTHGRVFSETDDSAKWIRRNAQAGPLYTVAHPQEVGSLITKQWFYHWDEVEKYPALLECFWNSDHELIGLSLTFGENRRIFGGPNIEQQVNNAICTRSFLRPGDFMVGLCLYIPGIDPLGQGEHTAIKGITPLLFDHTEPPAGQEFVSPMGQTEGNHRPLLTPDYPLVGLTGSVNENGVICRLGVLSCAFPPHGSNDYTHKPTIPDFSEIPQLQRLLWRPNNISITSDEARRRLSHNPPSRRVYPTSHDAPIWGHCRLAVLPFPAPVHQEANVPNDFIPHEAMVWAENTDQFRQVCRISACVNSHVGSLKDPNPTGAILGLSVQCTGRNVDPIGYVTSIQDKDSEPGCRMHHFDIDGPGGEIVTEIAVSTTSHRKAIKLRTNRNRIVCFGQETPEEAWEVQILAAGLAVAGIAVWFATPTAWDSGTNNHKFLGMTSAATVTMATEDVMFYNN